MRAIKFAVPARSPVSGLRAADLRAMRSSSGDRGEQQDRQGTPPIPPRGCQSIFAEGWARLCGL